MIPFIRFTRENSTTYVYDVERLEPHGYKWAARITLHHGQVQLVRGHLDTKELILVARNFNTILRNAQSIIPTREDE